MVRIIKYKDNVKEKEFSKTLLEFCDWLNRAKNRGAVITPNGLNGCIVILENTHFVAEV